MADVLQLTHWEFQTSYNFNEMLPVMEKFGRYITENIRSQSR